MNIYCCTYYKHRRKIDHTCYRDTSTQNNRGVGRSFRENSSSHIAVELQSTSRTYRCAVYSYSDKLIASTFNVLSETVFIKLCMCHIPCMNTWPEDLSTGKAHTRHSVGSNNSMSNCRQLFACAPDLRAFTVWSRVASTPTSNPTAIIAIASTSAVVGKPEGAVKLLGLTVILASKTQFQTRKSAAPGNTALKIMQPGQAYRLSRMRIIPL
jgi:hypothetical protein